jgi:4-cresol dehydrogenase (hydroxylating)
MKVINRTANIARSHFQRIEKGLHVNTISLCKVAGKLALLDSLLALCDLKKGIPSNFFLSTVYWRNLHKLDLEKGLDLERDRIGLLWAAPCISIQGEAFNEVTRLMNEYCRKYHLECPISATLLNQRQMEVVLSLSFDLDSHTQTDNAMNCYKDLLEKCAEKGFIKYRLSTYSNEFTQNESLGLNASLLKLNEIFDPCNVISPNKYAVVNQE